MQFFINTGKYSLQISPCWKIFANIAGNVFLSVRMLLKGHVFSSMIAGDDMDAMEKHLEESNAFKEHDNAQLKIIKEG